VIGIKLFNLNKTKARMDNPTHSCAMNALKRQKEAKRHKSIAKDFCDSLIQQTALSWLNKAREKYRRNNLPYGKMLEVVQGLLDVGVHVYSRKKQHELLAQIEKVAVI
jgi:hypothetical protein